MKVLLRQLGIGVVVLTAMLFLHPVRSHTQGAASLRRLMTRTNPAYPSQAPHVMLEGSVKVEALVSPDGSVKTVEIRGGQPVLAQAAANAVRNWKWEATSHESHEFIEVKFLPE